MLTLSNLNVQFKLILDTEMTADLSLKHLDVLFVV